MSDWSEAKCAGYALAALVADDRALEAVAGLIPEPAESRTRGLMAHEGSADKTARRRLVERLLSAVRPPLQLEDGLPTRLVALLATRLPRAQARTLLASAPTTRAVFSVPDDLWARLHRIARHSISKR